MIDAIISLIWMIVAMYLLGYSILRLLKIPVKKSIIYETINIFAYGFGVFIIISYILNWLSLIYWWIYIILGCIYPLIIIIKPQKIKETEYSFNFKKELPIIIVIVVSLIMTFVLIQGAFTYQHLEDDDSWDHASAAYTIAQNHNSQKSLEELKVLGRLYMDPYPPAYPYLMSNLYQLNKDINWTLKFFNSILIFFAPLFFFLFIENVTKSSMKAMVAAAVIAVLPSFMTHFIWSQTLAILLLFAGLLIISEYKRNFSWLILGSITFSALILSQPSAALIGYVLLGIYLAVSLVFISIEKKSFVKAIKLHDFMIYALIIGVVLPVLLFYGPMISKYGFAQSITGIGFTPSIVDKTQGDDTSGGAVYSFNEIINAPLGSKIDQQTGVGEVVSIFVLLTIIILLIKFKKSKKQEFFWISLLFLIFTILGLQSNALPIRLFPHRFWVFLSIPIAMLFAEGIGILNASLKNRSVKLVLFLILFIGVLYTSAYPRYVVQTAYWGAGGNFGSPDEINGYIWLKNNVAQAYVFNACGPAEKVIGVNMHSYPLDLELAKIQDALPEMSADEIYSYLKSKDFEYITIDSFCVIKYAEGNQTRGIERTNSIITKISQDQRFTLSHQATGFLLIQVN